MKVIGFMVRLECDACRGEKLTAAGVACAKCKGLGHIEGVTSWGDFEKLMHGLFEAAVSKAVRLSKELRLR